MPLNLILTFFGSWKPSHHAEKYVRRGRLNWPEGAATRESIRAVLKLPRLQVKCGKILVVGWCCLYKFRCFRYAVCFAFFIFPDYKLDAMALEGFLFESSLLKSKSISPSHRRACFHSNLMIGLTIHVSPMQNLVMQHVDHSAGDFIDLLKGLLAYEPSNRLTAQEALSHRFFTRYGDRRSLWY